MKKLCTPEFGEYLVIAISRIFPEFVICNLRLQLDVNRILISLDILVNFTFDWHSKFLWTIVINKSVFSYIKLNYVRNLHYPISRFFCIIFQFEYIFHYIFFHTLIFDTDYLFPHKAISKCAICLIWSIIVFFCYIIYILNI